MPHLNGVFAETGTNAVDGINQITGPFDLFPIGGKKIQLCRGKPKTNHRKVYMPDPDPPVPRR